MGATVDEALKNAAAAIAEWVGYQDVPEPRSIDQLREDPEIREQLADGSAFVVVPVVFERSRPVKANISLDAGLLAAIDEAANISGLTRSSFLSSAAINKIFYDQLGYTKAIPTGWHITKTKSDISPIHKIAAGTLEDDPVSKAARGEHGKDAASKAARGEQ